MNKKAIITISGLVKEFSGNTCVLHGIDLEINRGEIFALLGPNGAGKTTLISSVCGLNKITSGNVTVDGYDVERDYRQARSKIGLVPQELMLDIFATVWNTIDYSRGFYGKKRDVELYEQVLRDLALWDKKDTPTGQLSGGMKRRVMIAKALMNEPEILFLDEPTAGVDVELRRGMWDVVQRMKDNGTTVILTTHYLEEAEEMADRIGVINKGKIVLVEETSRLLQRLGNKTLTIELNNAISSVPSSLSAYNLTLAQNGLSLGYSYKPGQEKTGITSLLSDIQSAGLSLRDLDTQQSSLEEIFLSLTERSNN